MKRDASGWPEAFWQLAGSDPEFSTGTRPERHERSDVFRRCCTTREFERVRGLRVVDWTK